MVICPRCGGTGQRPVWEIATSDPRSTLKDKTCFKCRGKGRLGVQSAADYVSQQRLELENGKMERKMKIIAPGDDFTEKFEQRKQFLRQTSAELEKIYTTNGVPQVPPVPPPVVPPPTGGVPGAAGAGSSIIKAVPPGSMPPPSRSARAASTMKNVGSKIATAVRKVPGGYALAAVGAAAILSYDLANERAKNQREEQANELPTPEITDGSVYYNQGRIVPVDPWLVQRSFQNRTGHHRM